jgi:hypothetical protein
MNDYLEKYRAELTKEIIDLKVEILSLKETISNIEKQCDSGVYLNKTDILNNVKRIIKAAKRQSGL